MNGSAAAAAVALAAAFWVCWRYRTTGQLLYQSREELRPVTLQDQQTIEWIAALRAPHTGRHVSTGRHRGAPADRYSGPAAQPSHAKDPYLR